MIAARFTDPSSLTQAQRRALALAARPGVRLTRAANGYGHAPHKVGLNTAGELIALGLARVDRTGRKPRLVLTYDGKNVEAVIEARAARRHHQQEARP